MFEVRSSQEVPWALASDQGTLPGRQSKTNLCAVIRAPMLSLVALPSAVDTRQISEGDTRPQRRTRASIPRSHHTGRVVPRRMQTFNGPPTGREDATSAPLGSETGQSPPSTAIQGGLGMKNQHSQRGKDRGMQDHPRARRAVREGCKGGRR